jgi:uncharacterized protein YndB with AHSA1/START domain
MLDSLVSAGAQRPTVKIELGATGEPEIVGETHIGAPPATVYALLANAEQMKTWLAQSAEADAKPGGIFRLADPNGLWVEGTYLEVAPDRKVAFSWGGIDGLEPGQSVVEFTLKNDPDGTSLRLRHFYLSEAALQGHCLGWTISGLPKLKNVAEGGVPRGTCLGDASDAREQHPYAATMIW